jgi:predicted O-methyltransferase YrrM
MSSKRELKYLSHCMQDIREGGIVVELGSYKGESAMALGHGIKKYGKNAKLFCVDPFVPVKLSENPSKGEKKFNKNLRKYNMRLIFEKNMAKYPHSTLQEKSEDAHVRFQFTPIDFIYIDAEHTFKAVLNDIRKWINHINIGGVMCGHDYNLPDVKRAVDSYFSTDEYKIETPVDKIWKVII